MISKIKSDLFRIDEDKPGFLKITYKSNLVYNNLTKLKKALNHLLEESIDEIVFDFRNCNLIDSATIGYFVVFLRKLRDRNVRIEFINVSEYVNEIFKVIKINYLVDFNVQKE